MLYNPKTQGVGYYDTILFVQNRDKINYKMVDLESWKRRQHKLDKSEMKSKKRRLKEYG